MVFLYILAVVLVIWIACARVSYRLAVQNEWLRAVHSGGGKPYNCPDYQENWHPFDDACPKCRAWSKENFVESRRNRVLLALGLGPYILIANVLFQLVSGRQPLPRGELEHKLAQAEKELGIATGKLERS